ncbi:mitochondrial carrier domain-containing protein [Tribonema minus]|uniref:Mitochondrial carrier domain-containing protein n=1 Tax=Tribonema minus TaxID=303371 RepID=A0A835YJ97_9STRA|nr:mitochondrial carrier domain-containing protein [Tribonema minus]
MPHQPSFVLALVSGGIAGTSVDVALFPLDTIKTRLQSSQGFIKAGGFKGVYNGLSAAAVGSAPGAAAFFSTYEGLKVRLGDPSAPSTHMAAASGAEIVACLVRVPTENVKQKMQAGVGTSSSSAVATCRSILSASGARGFYAGYMTTIMREIPFSLIQFPLYERMKAVWGRRRGAPVHSYQAAVCGSLSGAFAGALTTPFDVVKTRLMLGADKHGLPYKGMVPTFQRIVADEGAAALFGGIVPRVMWIGIGGFVFFGAYEASKRTLAGVL